MKTIFAVLLALGLVSPVLAQVEKATVSLTSRTGDFELVGDLGVKLGETATVTGIVVEGPFKGYEGGPNLIVQQINGESNQLGTRIPLTPYFGKFGGERLPVLENGKTYSLRVYETGEFVGKPRDAYKEAGIMLQTTGFYFRNRLSVISGSKVESITWDPGSFVGRNALLAGIAANENDVPFIKSTKWKLELRGVEKWTKEQLGKNAEVYGTVSVKQSPNVYAVDNCQHRLVELSDQIGKTVSLRGTARSLNGHRWFNYRGTDMYVENMEKLPEWTGSNHWRPMEITGTLEQAEMPRIDQISLKPDRDLDTYYIVREPRWTPVENLLAPELPAQN